MVTLLRRRNVLPGSDPLMVQKFMSIFWVVALLVLFAQRISLGPLPEAQSGHLPWPFVQWLFLTLPGLVALTFMGGILIGLPTGWCAAQFWLARGRPADLTDLDQAEWAAQAIPPWRVPGGPTKAVYWLGRGSRQRLVSLFAIAGSALLVLGAVAVLTSAYRYQFSHLGYCVGPGGERCAPTFDIELYPVWLSLTLSFLCFWLRVRYVEWRCGITFRAVTVTRVPRGGYNLHSYFCRQGITAGDAAVRLARYTGPSDQPRIRRVLWAVLYLLPCLLGWAALTFASAWLPTQWIFT